MLHPHESGNPLDQPDDDLRDEEASEHFTIAIKIDVHRADSPRW